MRNRLKRAAHRLGNAGARGAYAGNNATLRTDYADSIANRTKASGTGAFRFGAANASGHQDFDQSLSPINSYEQGGAGGSYTVRGGFAGGVGEMFTVDNWLARVVVASPVIPLSLWLRVRARYRVGL